MEEWKQIKRYDYKISSFGRIKRGKNSMIPILLNDKGYYYCSLWKNDILSKPIYIHRLVAKTFIPNPNKLHIVDHCNQVITDNRVINLRWVTHQENMNNRRDNRRAES